MVQGVRWDPTQYAFSREDWSIQLPKRSGFISEYKKIEQVQKNQQC